MAWSQVRALKRELLVTQGEVAELIKAVTELRACVIELERKACTGVSQPAVTHASHGIEFDATNRTSIRVQFNIHQHGEPARRCEGDEPVNGVE